MAYNHIAKGYILMHFSLWGKIKIAHTFPERLNNAGPYSLTLLLILFFCYSNGLNDFLTSGGIL